VRISDQLAVTSKKEIADADQQAKSDTEPNGRIKDQAKTLHFFAGRGGFLLDQLLNG